MVTDWTLELVFRRDIVQMDIARSEGIRGAHHEAGASTYCEGELARNFYTILTGEVQIYRLQGGEESPVATLGAGEYFGEMSLLRGTRHTASVRALSSVDLLIMSGTDFKELATSSRYFREGLDNVMERREAGSGATRPAGEGHISKNGPELPSLRPKS